MRGKTGRRLALVILLTALVPLAVGLTLANSLFKKESSVWINPDVDGALERGVLLYREYIKMVKEDMRHQTDAITSSTELSRAIETRSLRDFERLVTPYFSRYPALVSLTVLDIDSNVLVTKTRGTPIHEATERSLEVRRAIGEGDKASQLVATFAFDRRYEDELRRAGEIRDLYGNLGKDHERVYSAHVKAFALLLGITMIVTVTLGFILARGLTRRINRLARAIERVAKGELDVRVPVTGSDELTELASVFNRMLSEMQQSRARIEYLQRIGAWQEMAQRLAHEIKNPLTPIQLAVQECHRKYGGDDPKFRGLLDTTLEIVEEEVGTLRRLVGSFSNFARLPHAELIEGDLSEFLRDSADQLGHLEDGATDAAGESDAIFLPNLKISWNIPESRLPCAIDKQMLRRAVLNLVRNAAQAIRDARRKRGGDSDPIEDAITVSARASGDFVELAIDDTGPGIDETHRERIFDPYFTTKSDGTGLGLAIVKKIVVEHGGTIEASTSTALSGARIVVCLPRTDIQRAPIPVRAVVLSEGV